MNSAGDNTSVNIFQNIDNIKKIQLISYCYNMSLADTLKFIRLKCYFVQVKYKYIFLGEICIYPRLWGNNTKINKFFSTDD